MGRSIQPNPDAPRCRGKNGAGTCPFPDATCRMNKRDRNGIAMWKKMCWGCSTGKPPPAPRPAPQPRPVQGQQLNSFGGLASTVSPTPIGRGNPGNRTKWDGTARQFPDRTSQDAIAYNTRRDGGDTRRYHPWSDAIGKQFQYLHCVRNESRLNTDGSCVSDQYDPTHHALAAASAPRSCASYVGTAQTPGRTMHSGKMPAMPAAESSRSVRTRSTRPSTTRRSSRPAPSTSLLKSSKRARMTGWCACSCSCTGSRVKGCRC